MRTKRRLKVRQRALPKAPRKTADQIHLSGLRSIAIAGFIEPGPDKRQSRHNAGLTEPGYSAVATAPWVSFALLRSGSSTAPFHAGIASRKPYSTRNEPIILRIIHSPLRKTFPHVGDIRIFDYAVD